ncbi:ABC transporter permease [Bacillus solimangrovi]|uniref:ABC transmembrane type-2 domain-containing protein n=1 Tax=Bacillus solimangrovi TaxID=1305675 RepID=A0A1E5LHM7_9BACI|nr:ABC transporter permease [Bacillus solimangrovi]OEH93575.1 hypothetical protein BFG57_00895 [Bacillus solimangrovi]
MKSFIIAWNDFLIRVKDRKGFLLMLIMPLMITSILGFALGGVMNNEVKLPHTTVGVFVPDYDQLSTGLVEGLLKNPDVEEFIEVIDYSSTEEVELAIEDNIVEVGLIVPDKWSNGLIEQNIQDVKLLTSSNSDIQLMIVDSIVRSYVQRAQIISTTSHLVLSDIGQSVPVMTGEQNMDHVISDFVTMLRVRAETEPYDVRSSVIGERAVTSMQYYAAGMGMMFLLFNVIVGGKVLLNERTNQTLERLNSTSTSRVEIIFGKFLGTFFYCLCQMIVFISMTYVLLKVDWGSNVLQVFVIGLVYCFAISGLSIIIASLLQDDKAIDLSGSLIVQIFALLGGSMVPIYLFPDILHKLSMIAPNKWALSSFLDIMLGVNWSDLMNTIIVLAAIGIISLCIGTLRFKVR